MPRIYLNEWPPQSPPALAKKENVLLAARLMANAALTAPVSGGIHGYEADIAYGAEELEAIAREMERLAHQEVPRRLKKMFLYEAAMLRETDVVLFIASFRAHSAPFDVGCGLCGGKMDCSFFYERVSHVNGIVDTTDRSRKTAIKGPMCMCRIHDLGYALGSALWIAADLFVDCKPLYSVGLAGRNLNYCPNSEVVVGIPLAVLAKNPYVDIPSDYHLINMKSQVDGVRRTAAVTRQLGSIPYQHFDPSQEKKEKDEEREG